MGFTRSYFARYIVWMTIGYIGLGKMGKNMVLRLLEQGVDVVAWNRSPEPLEEVQAAGAQAAKDIEDLVTKLRQSPVASRQPLIVWLMLPAGAPTDEYIDKLIPLLQKGDLLIDGANSFYKDTLRRAQKLSDKGISFMDVAVSGGPGGARNGACLMVGGEKEDFSEALPILEKIAAPKAYAYLGKAGAGHFAKMIHNGIEYGMMQAIAEGAAILHKSDFNYDLEEVFKIYNNRSVIESSLVRWTKEIFAQNPQLTGISSFIGRLGEGDWTVDIAKEMGIAVPIIEESLNVRKRSTAESEDFRDKVVTALRGQFGGHSTK